MKPMGKITPKKKQPNAKRIPAEAQTEKIQTTQTVRKPQITILEQNSKKEAHTTNRKASYKNERFQTKRIQPKPSHYT